MKKTKRKKGVYARTEEEKNEIMIVTITYTFLWGYEV